MTYACPSCDALHEEPNDPVAAAPVWLIPKRTVGDHRLIYECAFCDARICVACYVDHTRRHL